MKKMCMNVGILSLALLIGGCANGPESTTDAGTSEENSHVASDMGLTGTDPALLSHLLKK